MDHRGEAARPTVVGPTDLGMDGGAVQGGEAHYMSASTFHGQLGAAAARRASFEASSAAFHNSHEYALHVRAAAGRGEVPVAAFHRQTGPGVVYAGNIGAFWRQLAPLDAVLVGPQLPDGVVQVHDSSFYSALQPRPRAGRDVVLADLLHGGAGVVTSLDYVLQPCPGSGHGDVLGDLFPVTDGAGHGELFVGLHPGGVDAVYDNYGYYPWQPRLGGGRGEVFIPDGVVVVFVGLGNFAQQTLPGTVRADGIGGMLRDTNLAAEHDGSGTLVDDLDAVYDDHDMAAEHLRRLLAIFGIGACSVAVNALAASPGSPAVAFHLFVLLLAGLFLHVLRV